MYNDYLTIRYRTLMRLFLDPTQGNPVIRKIKPINKTLLKFEER